MVVTEVENEPAVWRPAASPASMTARAPSARWSAPASAVARHESKVGVVLAAVGLGQDRRARVRRRAVGDGIGALHHRSDAALVQPVRAGHADPLAVE